MSDPQEPQTRPDAAGTEPVAAAPEPPLPTPTEEPLAEPVLAAAAAAEPTAEATADAAAPPAPPDAPAGRRRPGRQPAAPPAPKPLAPYAVVETGGKQYRVSVGDTLSVERLPVAAGAELTLDRVLLLGGDGTTRVGAPTVAGAVVTARVDEHGRGEKIVVFKYKPKKRYRRRLGHRQELTRLTITGITG